MYGDQKTYVKRCMDCGADTLVKDSRERPDGSVFRRRVCSKCGYKFQTLEVEECMIDLEFLYNENKALKKENYRLKSTIQSVKKNLNSALKSVGGIENDY